MIIGRSMLRKAVSVTMLTLLLIGVFCLALSIQPVKSESRTIIVPDDYPTIQEAINHASVGDIVFVRAGVYFENVIIDKTVSVIGEDKRRTIIDGLDEDVIVIAADNVLVANLTIRNSNSAGIYVDLDIKNWALSNNIIANHYVGIRLGRFMKNGVIYQNMITNNTIGIGWGRPSIRCSALDNVLLNNSCGMFLEEAFNCIIENNSIMNSLWGIVAYRSCSCKFTQNNVNNCKHSFSFWECSNFTLRNNTIANSKFPLGIDGFSSSMFIHDIDVSNTIDGKKVYYLVNRKDMYITPNQYPDVGYLAIINSTNISVEGFTFRNNCGILLAFATNCTVKNMNLIENNYGIRMVGTQRCFLLDNLIGINGIGITMFMSKFNTICENNIHYNNYGLYLSNCYSNKIYHNNFIGNKVSAASYPYPTKCIQIWDNGYPSGGNYWSDYNGTDLFSGLYQNETGSDGIGDIPYMININNIDRYPLMNPYTVTPSVPSVINATVDVNPKALNLRSRGKWITGYIELPEGYNVNDVDVSTMMLDGTVSVDLSAPIAVGDYDNDTVQDLMVCFNWPDLAEYILSRDVVFGNITLKISGKLYNGSWFIGTDTILVSSLIGDVNIDGKVDIKDIYMAATAFGSYPGHPRYNPNTDFTKDGKIDIQDIYLIARNFGKHA